MIQSIKCVRTCVVLRIVALLAAAGLAGGVLLAGYMHWRVHRFDKLIAEACAAYDVDPALVSAVIRRESSFNPRAVGRAGEAGLMQVTAPAAREWMEATGAAPETMAGLFKPENNIHAGTWYLGRALMHWSHKADPLPYALAEYNAGRSNVNRWSTDDGGDPAAFIAAITYPSTRRYVRDILDNYRAGSASE